MARADLLMNKTFLSLFFRSQTWARNYRRQRLEQSQQKSQNRLRKWQRSCWETAPRRASRDQSQSTRTFIHSCRLRSLSSSLTFSGCSAESSDCITFTCIAIDMRLSGGARLVDTLASAGCLKFLKYQNMFATRTKIQSS